jgi:hypothetical protein
VFDLNSAERHCRALEVLDENQADAAGQSAGS